jgi:hypothetical protein
MNRGFPQRLVIGVTDSLAIQSNDTAQGGYRLHPLDKSVSELLGVQCAKYIAKRIMGGDPMFEHQESGKPVPFRIAKPLDGRPVICPANDGTDSNEEYFDERVAPPRLTSRVIYFSKI